MCNCYSISSCNGFLFQYYKAYEKGQFNRVSIAYQFQIYKSKLEEQLPFHAAFQNNSIVDCIQYLPIQSIKFKIASGRKKKKCFKLVYI